MSIQAVAWAIEQQVITEPSSRLVLICLCNYADATGDSIYPSVARLCRDTGLSERALQYQLRKLQQAGILVRSNPAIVAARVSRADRLPTCYRVVMTGCNPLHLDASRGATHCTSSGSRGAIYDVTGCNLEQNGVQPIAPDPSSDPSLNLKSARAIPEGSRVPTKEERRDYIRQLKSKAGQPFETSGKRARR